MDLRTLIYQVLAVQGCTQTLGSFGPSWSITNELFYYLLFAVLVTAIPRNKNAPLLVGLLGCLIVGVAFQLVYSAGLKFAIVHKTGMMIGLGVNWFLGALVAQYRDVLCRNRPIVLASRAWPILLIGSIAVLSAERVRPGFALILAGVAFSGMVIDFLACDARRSAMSDGLPALRRFAQMLGLASYPLYLFHGPIMLLVGAFVIRLGVSGDRHVTWVAASLVALPVGLALGFLAERPIMAWRADFLARRRRRGSEIGAMRIGAHGTPRGARPRIVQEAIS